MKERDDLVILIDEDGNEAEFEYLDIIEKEGKQYIVLLPLDGIEDEEGEVVILQFIETEERTEFLPLESMELLDELFVIFQAHLAELMDPDDDDDDEEDED